MREDTLSKFCISACLFMTFVSLSFNFVASLGIFPLEMAPVLSGSTTDIYNKTTGQTMDSLPSNMAIYLVETVVGLAGFGIIVLMAMASGGWNLIAAYIMGIVFWSTWVNNLVIFYAGGFYDIPGISLIVGMLSIGMILIFIGAITGILGGND